MLRLKFHYYFLQLWGGIEGGGEGRHRQWTLSGVTSSYSKYKDKNVGDKRQVGWADYEKYKIFKKVFVDNL